MSNEFNVTRYALEIEGKAGTPMFDTFKEARDECRKDRKAFAGSSRGKSRVVAVDLTDRVREWAETIAYAARNPEVSVQDTTRSIVELIRFTQRGY